MTMDSRPLCLVLEYRCVFGVAFTCREGDVIAELELTLPFAPFIGLNVAGLLKDPWGSAARVGFVTWIPATEIFRVAYHVPDSDPDIFDSPSSFEEFRTLFVGCGWRWSGLPEKVRTGSPRKP